MDDMDIKDNIDLDSVFDNLMQNNDTKPKHPVINFAGRPLWDDDVSTLFLDQIESSQEY
jgi:hypothetical protein